MKYFPTSFQSTCGAWWKDEYIPSHAFDSVDQPRKENGQFGSGGLGAQMKDDNHEKSKVGETEHHTIHKYSGFGEKGNKDIHMLKSKKDKRHVFAGNNAVSWGSHEEAKHFSNRNKDKPVSMKDVKETRREYVASQKGDK